MPYTRECMYVCNCLVSLAPLAHVSCPPAPHYARAMPTVLLLHSSYSSSPNLHPPCTLVGAMRTLPLLHTSWPSAHLIRTYVPTLHSLCVPCLPSTPTAPSCNYYGEIMHIYILTKGGRLVLTRVNQGEESWRRSGESSLVLFSCHGNELMRMIIKAN